MPVRGGLYSPQAARAVAHSRAIIRAEMTDSGAGEAELREQDLQADWLGQLRLWLDDARTSGISEPEAMVLATADTGARPSARTVLLKRLDERGLVFHSNRQSRKGGELAANPRAAAVFPWYPIRRQVIVEGAVSLLPDEDSDEYFASRPYRSRIGALASRQSSVIDGRAALDEARSKFEARYPEGSPVPRPSWWGGWLIVPDGVEFWQGRRDRMHDRLRYRRDGAGWVIERLSP